jgi:protein-S-isoprenylcysteine O-methyltransferase Ste14
MENKYLEIAFIPLFVLLFVIALGLADYFNPLKYVKTFPFVLLFVFGWLMYFLNRYDEEETSK